MRRFLSLTILLSLLACTASAPSGRSAGSKRAGSHAERVVLVSFDGLGADALARQSGLASFARLAKEGASARVIPVNPTITGPAHVAILTGADPQKNGIVANRFHIAGTPPDVTAFGMSSVIGVETLLESARRQGKRVGSISFPTIDGSSPRRTSDFGLSWTKSLTEGRLIRLGRSDFHREWVPPGWTTPKGRRNSFSPLMRARLEWSVPKRPVVDVDLVACDTTDDGTENYDAFFVESGDVETTPDAKGWFPVARVNEQGLHGSWSKLIAADPKLQKVEIYWGPISRSVAWPDSFRSTLDAELGFWPGEADEEAGLDAATFAEQSARFSEYLLRATLLAIEREDFDLLFAYQPQIDSAMHAYLGAPGGEPVIRSAFEQSDRAIGALRNALDLTRDALVVTGDHGVARIDTEVRMTRLLTEAGLAPRWRAYASANVAHLYRFGAPDDTAAVVRMLTATHRFESVERKGATAHANSGDIIAIGYPNVLLTVSAEAPAVARPKSFGSHGASNTHREMHSVLFATGAAVRSGPLGDLPQTRIARFVSTLLGIQPPSAAE